LDPDSFSGAVADLGAGCLRQSAEGREAREDCEGDGVICPRGVSEEKHFSELCFLEAGWMVANRITGVGTRENTRQQRRHTSCKFVWMMLKENS